MHSHIEAAASGERQSAFPRAANENSFRSAPRRRKGILLPQIGDLALEGHSCREIAVRLGVGKTTVHRWLQELGEECRSKVADAGEMIANAAARYDSIYREAMEAWRNSKAEKQVRMVEETEAAGSGNSKKKRSIRTECRAGDAAFLDKAKRAVDAFCKLVPREALRQSKVAAPETRPIDLKTLTDEEFHKLADVDPRTLTDAELTAYAAEADARFAKEQNYDDETRKLFAENAAPPMAELHSAPRYKPSEEPGRQ